jgi:hypothetical protein
VTQGHQQGQGVVHAGVGVDQELLLRGHLGLVVGCSRSLASRSGRGIELCLTTGADLTGASVEVMVGQGPPYAPA